MKILVVDDNEDILYLLKLTISGDVSLAATGKEALRLFHETHPDIVLLDCMMPDIDGIELATRMREHDKDVHIIMITALDRAETIEKALNAGVDDYIEKPFTAQDIKSRVEAAVPVVVYRKEMAARFKRLKLNLDKAKDIMDKHV